jgi:hypothetical protein
VRRCRLGSAIVECGRTMAGTESRCGDVCNDIVGNVGCFNEGFTVSRSSGHPMLGQRGGVIGQLFASWEGRVAWHSQVGNR